MIDVILMVLIIMSIIIGAFSLYKYKKTKQKKFLWLGLALTLVIPGILILILIWWIISSTMVTCYAPIDPGEGTLSTIIGLPLFLKQRDIFVNKFKDQVSNDVFDKISKKKK